MRCRDGDHPLIPSLVGALLLFRPAAAPSRPGVGARLLTLLRGRPACGLTEAGVQCPVPLQGRDKYRINHRSPWPATGFAPASPDSVVWLRLARVRKWATDLRAFEGAAQVADECIERRLQCSLHYRLRNCSRREWLIL